MGCENRRQDLEKHEVVGTYTSHRSYGNGRKESYINFVMSVNLHYFRF